MFENLNACQNLRITRDNIRKLFSRCNLVEAQTMLTCDVLKFHENFTAAFIRNSASIFMKFRSKLNVFPHLISTGVSHIHLPSNEQDYILSASCVIPKLVGPFTITSL